MPVRRHLPRLAIALCCVAGASPNAAAGDRTTTEIEIAAGVQQVRFAVTRPEGVVLRFRLRLPRGSSAVLVGRLGRIAGVGMQTGPDSCRSRGRELVCDQGVEWCPLPAGRWTFTLRKRSGPAGIARLEFVVGPPPYA